MHAVFKIDARTIRGHVLARGDAEDAHAALVGEVVEQFGGDEEVLGASPALARRPVFFFFSFGMLSEGLGLLGHAVEDAAGDADHTFVDEAFVAGIHTLVDLVDDAEGRAG